MQMIAGLGKGVDLGAGAAGDCVAAENLVGGRRVGGKHESPPLTRLIVTHSPGSSKYTEVVTELSLADRWSRRKATSKGDPAQRTRRPESLQRLSS